MTAVLQKEPPPSYSKVTQDQDHEAPPPSYEQIFGVGEMRQAREKSSNKGVFALKFYSICCGSIACTIGSIVLSALPVAMVVIGAIYLDDCPANRLIPIWLIVFGVISLFQTGINVFKRCFRLCKDEGSEDEQREYGRHGGNFCESLLSTFLFVWIIIGSVWVFRFYVTFQDNDCIHNQSAADCCHPVPYLFSLATLVAIYTLGALFLLCFCCCFCCCAFISGISE